MSFEEIVEDVGKVIEAGGVAVIVVGIVWSCLRYLVASRTVPAVQRYTACRHGVGRSILLGLEFLVAGDIIRTVAISPTYHSVGILAAIIAIRTFLSLSLEVELEGHWPWRSAPRAGVRDRS